jgi:uncharacterized protein
MKVAGEITIQAPRPRVFEKIRDARFFASCVDGVQDLVEVDATHYTAVFETKVAYMKFRFNVTVEVTRIEEPAEIEAKIEGTRSSRGSIPTCCGPIRATTPPVSRGDAPA